MSEIKAEKLLEAYDEERFEVMHKDLESLRPWKYRWHVEFILKLAFACYILWFVESDSFILENKFLFLLILVAAGSSYAETDKIHKRIDVLIKMFNSKPKFKSNNTE